MQTPHSTIPTFHLSAVGIVRHTFKIMILNWAIPILLVLWTGFAYAYKVAIFVPDISGSQRMLNKRVAETLAAKGHEVTMIMLEILPSEKADLKTSHSIEVWRLKAYRDDVDYVKYMNIHSMLAFEDESLFSKKSRDGFTRFTESCIAGCEILAKNTDFIDKLRNSKFDIAITHMYDYCTLGFIHHAKIPTWIWLNGAQLVDTIADFVGVPSTPSYVPSIMADASEKMTFMQRVKNFLGRSTITPMLDRALIDPETQVLRKHLDPNMPHLRDLAAECPLVMVNSDELIGFARPTLHKIIYVGGLGMGKQDVKPLKGEYKQIADRAKHIVVVSFGSVAEAEFMPQPWKDTLVATFKQFPEIEFVMRYSGHDLDAKLPANAHISNWIPQVDLLQHPKTLAFVTHSGYNSLQETIHSGKPIITIPLFGDQFANSRLAERRGFGLVISKAEFSEQKLVTTIREVLSNGKYQKNVNRLRAMLKAKPTKAEDLLVKWTEFLAEFKTLPNLVPYGTKLNLLVYHSIDVIAFLTAILVSVLFIFTCIASFICRKVCCRARAVSVHKKHN